MARKRFCARSHRFVVLLLLLTCAGCSRDNAVSQPAAVTKSEPPETELFVDVAADVGLVFEHRVSSDGDFFMPRCVGSGAALFDYDGDGRLDIYLVQNGGPASGIVNRLFRHQDDGQFVDVSAGSGLDVDGFGMGVATGDVNNDGKPDVVVSEYGRTRLFLNRTESELPRFEDVSEAAGINNALWGTSTCFVDYDRDGWLDLVLVNYVNYDPSRWCADGSGRQDFCGPDAFNGRVTKLYHNLGRQTAGNNMDGLVRFEDVTVQSGLAAHPGPGLGVFCADFDGDKWPDIFIANDGKPNHLWINGRDGTFKEEATLRGIGYNSMGKSEADMGVAIGDVDGDGSFDLFVTHLSTETHTLWRQRTRGNFQDTTATTGLTRSAWRGTGFGTVMADLDNDGALDLAVVNGRVTRSTGPTPPTPAELAAFWHPYAERDQLFMNDGTGKFRDVSEVNAAFSAEASVSRGMACGDLDGDGRLDLLVTRIAGPVALYRNVAPNPGHWLMVRAIDPALKRDAFGAEIYVSAGDKSWMRWINPGYSYLSSNDPRAHFGLGNVEQIDSIRVVWPDGKEELFPGGNVDREIQIRRGKGKSNA